MTQNVQPLRYPGGVLRIILDSGRAGGKEKCDRDYAIILITRRFTDAFGRKECIDDPVRFLPADRDRSRWFAARSS